MSLNVLTNPRAYVVLAGFAIAASAAIEAKTQVAHKAIGYALLAMASVDITPGHAALYLVGAALAFLSFAAFATSAERRR